MTPSHRHITVDPEPSGFGAHVSGVRLRDALPRDVQAEILEAWAAHGVLVFPDQPLDPAGLERVTRIFGPFGDDPFLEGMPAHPHVVALVRRADEKSILFGAAWHSDWSFQETPPSATLLHAQKVPPVGGNTRYADGARAWEALDPEWKERVRGLRAVHSARAAYGEDGVLAKDPHESATPILTGVAAHASRLHPVVRTHPVTGRQALFVNPVYTREIAGVSPEESKEILDFLTLHMIRAEFVYDHAWSANMLTVWDNRRMMHSASGGYEGHERRMMRTTVAGERPC